MPRRGMCIRGRDAAMGRGPWALGRAVPLHVLAMHKAGGVTHHLHFGANDWHSVLVANLPHPVAAGSFAPALDLSAFFS